MKGTVKNYKADKRFGFIVGADGRTEYFFHASAVKNANSESIREGMEVEFEPAESDKGPRAEDVYLS
jgi:CspA family cold shock protein